MEISSKIEEHVCEMDEDVYHYKFLGKDDLFFVKEGVVRSCLYGEFGYISESVIKKGYYIGLYQFITGLLIPHTALCLNYCFLYRIKRSDYKQILPEYLKYQLNSLQTKAFQYISEDNYL
jgi:hypothetical protein